MTTEKTGEVKKMMTKLEKTLMIVIAGLLIVIFISAGIYLQTSTKKTDSEMQFYLARKDDLTNQQIKLEAMIDQLNKTLVKETNREKKLSGTLTKLTGENSVLQAQQSAAASNTVTSIPKPTPQPIQNPTTRAS